MGRRREEQSYDKLRSHHRELGVPWTDNTFPANDSSIGLHKAREAGGGIEWRRVSDLCARPRLVVAGVGQEDARPGSLASSWFVAAASVLAGAGASRLWERAVPDHEDQEWDYERPERYSGVFKFNFWRFGSWQQVLVDDLIPTKDGTPVFTHSKDKNEWWAALMEKAYAKLHGSYEALDTGNLSDALVDFTGGVSELIALEDENGLRKFETDEDKRTELLSRLEQEVSEHSLVCCAVRAGRGAEPGVTECGLVRGHAYPVTAVRRVSLGDSGMTWLINLVRGRDKVGLVRLRNPWGERQRAAEARAGTRLYSARSLTVLLSRSPEWRSITARDRDKLGLVTRDQGEFWMPWDDFVVQFTDLSITHLINTSLLSFSKTWREFTATSRWSRPARAGGCLNHTATFLDNPQYRFDISSDEAEVIVQLSQIDNKSTVLASEKVKLVIGFHLLRVESNRSYRLHSVIPGSDTGASDYIKSTHVFLRKKLTRGRYLLLPTTFTPGQESGFLLRVFSDNCPAPGLVELERDAPPDPWCFMCGCGSRPSLVTRLRVVSGHQLVKQDLLGEADPYVLIKCEGERFKSEPVRNSQNPVWNFSVLLYRYRPERGIKIQVWNSNLVLDQFMGGCVIIGTNNPFGGDKDQDKLEKTMELYRRGKRQEEEMGGHVKLLIDSTDDLTAL